MQRTITWSSKWRRRNRAGRVGSSCTRSRYQISAPWFATEPSNLISFYATSLYQDLIHAEFNRFPWEGDRFSILWKRSPMAHIAKARTPTLLLHGELDNDVHITQAEEMYTALRERGVDA